MPKALLKDIDDEAAKDNRSRSNWIVTELTASVAMKRKLRGGTFKAVGEPQGADAGDPSTRSTRIPASALPEPKGDPRLNEDPVGARGPRARSTKPGVQKTVARDKRKSSS
jgi:hypothetical protein